MNEINIEALKVLVEIGTERVRQQQDEGWSEAHDDKHELGELAAAAGCYALSASGNPEHPISPDEWPWDDSDWKPTTARRNLIKAAALIVAEIERLDRQDTDNLKTVLAQALDNLKE